eukprot:1191388-Pyramimonas_sp.AAC.1
MLVQAQQAVTPGASRETVGVQLLDRLGQHITNIGAAAASPTIDTGTAPLAATGAHAGATTGAGAVPHTVAAPFRPPGHAAME